MCSQAETPQPQLSHWPPTPFPAAISSALRLVVIWVLSYRDPLPLIHGTHGTQT